MGPLFHLATKSSMASNNYQFDLNEIPYIEGVNEIQYQNEELDEERQVTVPLVVRSLVDDTLVLDLNTDGNRHYPVFYLNLDYLQLDANDDLNIEDTDSILNEEEYTDYVLDAGDDTDFVFNAGTLFWCSFAFKLRICIVFAQTVLIFLIC